MSHADGGAGPGARVHRAVRRADDRGDLDGPDSTSSRVLALFFIALIAIPRDRRAARPAADDD